ncbi:septum site-determining protein MinC [Iningainema tapete]|uniref:Probable septum site-determining protein MinC n=1 Tax=Iningainema tapete BLCC-T55 TaxID=2748662 RepID=A0A8J7CG05_9CYAN|nr:septum site-determining protein MinC [Iningainema tapete]MBD2775680.1 septum site-determining protein MinC [Iningainema tapete BLCC-T55]
MTFDSAIPDLKSHKALSDVESVSTLSEVESLSTISEVETNTVSGGEEHSILPEQEVESVILYLKSNSTPEGVNDNSDTLHLESELPLPELVVNHHIQVQIKHEEERLLLILPSESQLPASESSWSEISQQIKLRLMGGDRFKIPNSIIHLVAQDRLLDSRQLQELAETLSENQIQLKSVSTSRRQTAIAAASSGYCVEQIKPQTSLSTKSTTKQTQLEALYLEMTVRSGVEIRHPGSVIILGDVNPGGIVVADGDILVWGRLRGIAHAGANGNGECMIMALQMEPTQLRIADAVARGPEKSPTQFFPEVAYITPQGIRITKAIDFSRIQLSRINQ